MKLDRDESAFVLKSSRHRLIHSIKSSQNHGHISWLRERCFEKHQGLLHPEVDIVTGKPMVLYQIYIHIHVYLYSYSKYTGFITNTIE